MTSSGETAPRVLIADDSAPGRTSLRELLEVEGFEVALAETGDVCLETLRTRDMDLVLLDLFMSVKSGKQVLEEISATPELAGIPILLLAAASDRDELVACLDRGATDFVVKPWE